MELTDRLSQVIWAAGFIDGEGNITIGKGRVTKSGRQYFVLRMQASQVDPAPILLLKQIFGGSVAPEKSRVVGHADQFRWVCADTLAAKALREMLPYFVVKRNQALVGLQLQDSKVHHGGVVPTLTDEDMQQRQRLKDLINQLNKKGQPRGAPIDLPKRRKMQLRLIEEAS